MNNEAFYLVVGIVGAMFGIITLAYDNLDYKGFSSAHSCTGDCYVKYVEENGSAVDILRAQQAEAAGDPFSSIRGLWGGCAACHGQDGQGMGAFPKLAGQSSEYIVDRLTTYKNRGEVGAMSATMWAQAGMLSDQDIETLGNFIEETMK